MKNISAKQLLIALVLFAAYAAITFLPLPITDKLFLFMIPVSWLTAINQRRKERTQGIIIPWYKHFYLVLALSLSWFAGMNLIDMFFPKNDSLGRESLEFLVSIGLVVYVIVLLRRTQRNNQASQPQNLQ